MWWLLKVAAGVAACALVAGCAAVDSDVFSARFANNLHERVLMSLCADDYCRSPKLDYTDRLRVGQAVQENLAAKAPSGFVVKTPLGHVLGCVFVYFAKVPQSEPTIHLSPLVPCKG